MYFLFSHCVLFCHIASIWVNYVRDIIENLVYYLAHHQSFDSSIKVIIRDDLGEIYGLAVEWESEKIYFTDFIFERIEVANLNGSFRKTLITENLYSPRGIAVDPKSG